MHQLSARNRTPIVTDERVTRLLQQLQESQKVLSNALLSHSEQKGLCERAERGHIDGEVKMVLKKASMLANDSSSLSCPATLEKVS